jgi:DNA-binding FadR family transcriptional regulator
MTLEVAELTQLKMKRTFEVIVDLLKEKIITGELSPGDRLPPERALAEALGVGRPSVREAYRALELVGVIDIRKGAEGGAFIVEPTFESGGKAISDLLRLHNIELSTMAEARLFIESGTVELAAQRAAPEDIAKLEELMVQAERKVARGVAPSDESIAFHLALAEISGNPVLIMALSSINDLMLKFLKRLAPTPETAARELVEHNRILDAVRRGRPEEARRLMSDHLRHSQARLEEMIEAAGRTGNDSAFDPIDA